MIKRAISRMVISGDWKSQNGAFAQSTNQTFARATAGDPKWTNYTVSTKAYDQENATFGLVARRQGNSFYRYRIIANDNALPGIGIGKLVSAGLMRKTIASHIGLNPETQKKMIAGGLEVELVPQGTLIERIRAAGYGLGGILTPTGVGTVVEEGKQKIAVEGRDYLLETPLRADFALVQAFLCDYLGNLTYVLTARNFNPLIAMAADTVIVDAEHIVPVGLIPPDHVITPAAIVDYVVAH